MGCIWKAMKICFWFMLIISAIAMIFVYFEEKENETFSHVEELDAKELVAEAFSNLRASESYHMYSESNAKGDISKFIASESVQTKEIFNVDYHKLNDSYKITGDLVKDNETTTIEEIKVDSDIYQSIDGREFDYVSLDESTILAGEKTGVLASSEFANEPEIDDLIAQGDISVGAYESKKADEKDYYLIEGDMPESYVLNMVNQTFFGDVDKEASSFKMENLIVFEDELQMTIDKENKNLLSTYIHLRFSFEVEGHTMEMDVETIKRYSDFDEVEMITLPNLE